MKTTRLVFTLCAAILAAAPLVAGSGSGAHWGYEGKTGPKNWGDLDKKYHMCKEGMNQSPINITKTADAELDPIEFGYKPSRINVVNNGHTIKADYDAGSDISIDGRYFELKQFHFHTPSENHIEGKSYPMEAHFVHADRYGNLAVVGVVYEIGEADEELEKIWENMPKKNGAHYKSKHTVDGMKLLPSDKAYYRFSGSLTTPPCSEGVLWLVLKQPMTASKAQVQKFHKLFHHDTNRPVQPLNARKVLQ